MTYSKNINNKIVMKNKLRDRTCRRCRAAATNFDGGVFCLSKLNKQNDAVSPNDTCIHWR
jgi:hypothetical protein